MAEHLIARWEAAYRRYADLAQAAAGPQTPGPEAAQALADASWEVATAWRDTATTTALPWWILAALRAAAEAFEQQAHTWHTRTHVSTAGERGTRRRS